MEPADESASGPVAGEEDRLEGPAAETASEAQTEVEAGERVRGESILNDHILGMFGRGSISAPEGVLEDIEIFIEGRRHSRNCPTSGFHFAPSR